MRPNIAQSRLYAARLHSYGYLFRRFAEGVAKVEGELKSVLMDVCLLYGLYTIEENAGAFLQYEYCTPKQIEYIRAQTNVFCKAVRDQAIPLVDSFNFSDYLVNSPLGRGDGDVYVHYFDQVKRQNPQGEHPYFNRLIKPMLERDIDGGDYDDEVAGLESDDSDDESD